MHYPFVVFDVDGTLIDTKDAVLQASRMAVERLLGRPISPDELPAREVFALPAYDSALLLGLPDPDAYVRAQIETYQEIADEKTHLFPGMMNVLEALQKHGCQLGICTSRILEELSYDFKRFGLDKFDWITACADETPKTKPDPVAMNTLLQKAHIEKPSAVLYLGDLLTDYECAKGAHVAFAQAGWNDEAPIEGAKYVLRKPEEILDLVLGNQNAPA